VSANRNFRSLAQIIFLLSIGISPTLTYTQNAVVVIYPKHRVGEDYVLLPVKHTRHNICFELRLYRSPSSNLMMWIVRTNRNSPRLISKADSGGARDFIDR